MKIKAVAFDFDGTLYPERSLYIRSAALALRNPRFLWAYQKARSQLRVAKPASIPVNLQYDSYAQCNISMQGARKWRWEGFEEKRSTLEAFRREQATLIGQTMGLDEASAEVLANQVIYGALEKAFVHIEPYRGIKACLEALKRQNLQLAVLSDLPPWEKLRALGLDSYFDLVLCSECSGRLKPDPRPFSFLSERLGLDPAEILYVGNNWGNDIEGAKKAGLHTAFFGRHPRRKNTADFSFHDWKSLTSWVLGAQEPVRKAINE